MALDTHLGLTNFEVRGYTSQIRSDDAKLGESENALFFFLYGDMHSSNVKRLKILAQVASEFYNAMKLYFMQFDEANNGY